MAVVITEGANLQGYCKGKKKSLFIPEDEKANVNDLN